MPIPPAMHSGLPLQTFRRLPNYYTYLKALQKGRVPYVAALTIARDMGLNEVQVRKDLAAVNSSPGKPRKGFAVEELLASISECLGYHNREDAVLVGTGRLGKALLSYKGFEETGVRIVAGFDSDPAAVGKNIDGKEVFSMDKLASLCGRLNIHIGIITVPDTQAQIVCDALVAGGVLAIWNFAPIHLHVPDGGVLVHNENMAASLALLSQHLASRLPPSTGEGRQ